MTAVKIKNPKSEIRNPKWLPAFTLVELMVVIALIVLISAIALPSAIRLFSTGADTQATNIMAAQLSYARAIAIQNNTYAGVHVQMADAEDGSGPLNPDLEETCFSAIVIYDSSNARFKLLDGSKPRKIPGSIAFGKLDSNTVSGGDYKAAALTTQQDLEDFTTFTIVFSPAGQVVTRLPVDSASNTNGYVIFDNSGLFGDVEPAIWDVDNTGGDANNGGQPAATAITLFDYTELAGRTAASDRKNYLDEAGQFLPVNVYTGQLFPRK